MIERELMTENDWKIYEKREWKQRRERKKNNDRESTNEKEWENNDKKKRKEKWEKAYDELSFYWSLLFTDFSEL